MTNIRVLHNGQFQFNTTDSGLQVSGGDWNFTDGITPPVNDPNAITSASVYFQSDKSSKVLNATQLMNYMGKLTAASPAVAWPYIANALEVPIPANMHIRSLFNPTQLPDFRRLKGLSYQRVKDPGRRYKFAIVPAGLDWTQALPNATRTNFALQDNAVFDIISGSGSNPAYVYVTPGTLYDLLCAPMDAKQATVALGWNP